MDEDLKAAEEEDAYWDQIPYPGLEECMCDCGETYLARPFEDTHCPDCYEAILVAKDL